MQGGHERERRYRTPSIEHAPPEYTCPQNPETKTMNHASRIFGSGKFSSGSGFIWGTHVHESVGPLVSHFSLFCLSYTLLISIFRFFIQPMSSKRFVSKERNSR
ncbi:MAG: hypothetical protein [Olavius algarvensis Gamma 1 endosymbiont]|nr:MAG: hypothetical protein [Olavius algarvensis Gamma 1 endosymbiont]